ncbi:hypothetical protein BaRGS_00006200 [Batillaria attramentaria]|uniref:Uncharacterized protein n=1 Tax=Batillaria attramentaria TaxID=370345 RepID=A0ABD0LSR5_9CAEN
MGLVIIGMTEFVRVSLTSGNRVLAVSIFNAQRGSLYEKDMRNQNVVKFAHMQVGCLSSAILKRLFRCRLCATANTPALVTGLFGELNRCTEEVCSRWLKGSTIRFKTHHHFLVVAYLVSSAWQSAVYTLLPPTRIRRQGTQRVIPALPSDN